MHPMRESYEFYRKQAFALFTDYAEKIGHASALSLLDQVKAWVEHLKKEAK